MLGHFLATFLVHAPFVRQWRASLTFKELLYTNTFADEWWQGSPARAFPPRKVRRGNLRECRKDARETLNQRQDFTKVRDRHKLTRCGWRAGHCSSCGGTGGKRLLPRPVRQDSSGSSCGGSGFGGSPHATRLRLTCSVISRKLIQG